MKKKLLAFVLATVMIIACLPVSVFAQEYGDFTYVEQYNSIKITGYTGTDETVVIPDTINGKKVGYIGEKAFYKNNTIKNVIIGDNTTHIDSLAFGFCQNLESVRLPEYIYSMGTEAFRKCSSLKQVNVINVYSMGEWAFAYCEALENITLGEDIHDIGAYAFYNTGIKELHLPKPDCGRCILNDSSFGACKALTEIICEKGHYELGMSVFASCTGLTDVELDRISFKNELSSACFSGCTSLESVKINSMYGKLTDRVFNNCKSIKTIKIPEGCKGTDGTPFYNCTALETVILPNTMTNISRWAFRNCASLKDIYIPKSFDGTAVNVLEKSGTNSEHLNIHGVAGSAAEDIYNYNVAQDGAESFSFISIDSGDLDGDGEITISDYNMLSSMMFNNQMDYEGDAVVAADVNGDGAIDAFDMFYVDKTMNGYM